MLVMHQTPDPERPAPSAGSGGGANARARAHATLRSGSHMCSLVGTADQSFLPPPSGNRLLLVSSLLGAAVLFAAVSLAASDFG